MRRLRLSGGDSNVAYVFLQEVHGREARLVKEAVAKAAAETEEAKAAAEAEAAEAAAEEAKPIRRCETCGAARVPGIHALEKCLGCLAVHYCNRSCQRADWRQHKTRCRIH